MLTTEHSCTEGEVSCVAILFSSTGIGVTSEAGLPKILTTSCSNRLTETPEHHRSTSFSENETAFCVEAVLMQGGHVMHRDSATSLSSRFTAAQLWHLYSKSVSSCFPGILLGNQFSTFFF